MTQEQYRKMYRMIYGREPRTLNGCAPVLGWEWSDVWSGLKTTGKTALDIYGGYASQAATKEAYNTALTTLTASKNTLYVIGGVAIAAVVLYKVLK